MPTDKDGVVTITEKEVEERFKGWVDGCYCGWGVGGGWQEILYTLCKHIEDTLQRYKIPKEEFVVAQVKEKFGGLRFYWEWSSTEKSEDLLKRIELATKDIDELERMAERQAWATCEVCGQPGRERGGGWIKVRCDDCEAGKKRTWE